MTQELTVTDEAIDDEFYDTNGSPTDKELTRHARAIDDELALPPLISREEAAADFEEVRRNEGELRRQNDVAFRFAKTGRADFGPNHGTRPDWIDSAPIAWLDRDRAVMLRDIGNARDAIERARILISVTRRWIRIGEMVPRLRRILQHRGHLVESQARISAISHSPSPGAHAFNPLTAIATMAGRGITLQLTSSGDVVAAPAGLLNEQDRSVIREHKAAVVAAFMRAETF